VDAFLAAVPLVQLVGDTKRVVAAVVGAGDPATRYIRPGPSRRRISVSYTSRYGASGPSEAIARAAEKTRSACSNDAAATGMSGATGANGPANSTSASTAASAVLPKPFGLPTTTRL
jgi:hypothetical protein